MVTVPKMIEVNILTSNDDGEMSVLETKLFQISEKTRKEIPEENVKVSIEDSGESSVTVVFSCGEPVTAQVHYGLSMKDMSKSSSGTDVVDEVKGYGNHGSPHKQKINPEVKVGDVIYFYVSSKGIKGSFYKSNTYAHIVGSDKLIEYQMPSDPLEVIAKAMQQYPEANSAVIDSVNVSLTFPDTKS